MPVKASRIGLGLSPLIAKKKIKVILVLKCFVVSFITVYFDYMTLNKIKFKFNSEIVQSLLTQTSFVTKITVVFTILVADIFEQ